MVHVPYIEFRTFDTWGCTGLKEMSNPHSSHAEYGGLAVARAGRRSIAAAGFLGQSAGVKTQENF